MDRSLRTRWAAPLAVLLLAVGCREAANAGEAADAAPEQDAPATAVAQDIACVPTASGDDLTGRASPYDSVRVQIGGQTAQVCYSRPNMRGREIFGGLIPYDQLWRTGANEPTIIHLPVAASIAGIAVEPGSYSIYTVPGADQWQVVVNRSTSQWGHENRYTPEIEAQEVGRATVSATSIAEPIEQFTIRAEPAGDGSNVVLEWERTRVTIPITTG
jgi:hypothetical protein